LPTVGVGPLDDDDRFAAAFRADFVESAPVTEDDWKTRQREGKRAERRVRRHRRHAGRRRIGSWLWSSRTLALLVGVGALLVVAAGVAGSGPLGELLSPQDDTDVVAAGSERPDEGASGTTPTTDYQLQGREYHIGDCVLWDQDLEDDASRRTNVVPCDEPHLIEITGSHDVTGQFDTYPTESQWDAVFEGDCAVLNERHLGGVLDPMGRYYSAGLRPTYDGWELGGDRQVWCGIGALPVDEPVADDHSAVKMGAATFANQAHVRSPGVCKLLDEHWPVPCTEPHHVEFTGTVDLTGRVELPPARDDDDGWAALIGQGCRDLAESYLGRPLADDLASGWMPIEPGSWTAGRRLVECMVGRSRADEWVILTGPLREV
jgi:hypothetical protein